MVIDDKPIEKIYIPQPNLGNQSTVIAVLILTMVCFLQLTILYRINRTEESTTLTIDTMRAACMIMVADKGKP
jgi:hypothetical protein